MNLNALTDEELMRRLQSGVDAALAVIYERHSQKVWAYLFKRVPPFIAEDLFQDTFLKVFEKRDKWNGQPFVLWLYVVMRHTVADFYRGRKVEAKYREASEGQSAERDPAPKVDEILASLPKEKAKLLEEFFEEGWSYQELAQKYEITEVSIRKRLSRTLQVLKGSFTGEK